MSHRDATSLTARLTAMREAFDGGFATPHEESRVAAADALLVSIADESWLMPLHDCAGVFPAAAILALPGTAPAFRGVATIRGIVVPIYDLAALLGVTTRGESGAVVLTAGQHGVGLLVDRVEGCAAIERESISGEAGARAARAGGKIRRIVDVGRLIHGIGDTRSESR